MMKRLRRQEWEEAQLREDLDDEDKVWKTSEVLEEDIQNQEVKMTLIGCDVESLYPSLEIKECGEIVAEEVIRSKIK